MKKKEFKITSFWQISQMYKVPPKLIYHLDYFNNSCKPLQFDKIKCAMIGQNRISQTL